MPRTAVHAGSIAALILTCTAAWPQAQEPGPEAIPARPLQEGFHLLSGSGGNVLVWSGPQGTVLVDSGSAADAPRLAAALAGLAPDGVKFVINTHWHPDHTGANAALGRDGALLIAHETVRDRMAEPQELREYDLQVPASPPEARPVITFGDTLALHLNDDRLVLLHVAAAHTDGDGVAWWPDANVVHMGDLYYAAGYPFIETGGGGTLAGLIAAVETVLSRTDDATVVVPGHGPPSTRAELVEYRDMLVAIGRRVRELVEQGRSLEEVLAAHPTAAFDARYGSGGVGDEQFVRILFEDLSRTR